MLRPATDTDVQRMLEWRNQPANREVSNNQHVIGLDEHLAWWERAKTNDSRRDLIFEYDGRALGVVNFFDIDLEAPEKSAEWGFYLDNETTTAEGIAMLVWQRVMKEAISYAFDELQLDVLNAEVLAHNEAVRLTNRRFRFVEGESAPRTVGGRTFEVIPISLRRENRRKSRSDSPPSESATSESAASQAAKEAK